MSEYLYTLKANRLGMLTEGPTPEEAEVMARHAAYLREQGEKGVVALFGRTQNADESTFGLVVFEADSEDSARKLMEEDPAVKQGLMRARLFPYRIAFLREGST
jgi:uncharacterized protein YciI